MRCEGNECPNLKKKKRGRGGSCLDNEAQRWIHRYRAFLSLLNGKFDDRYVLVTCTDIGCLLDHVILLITSAVKNFPNICPVFLQGLLALLIRQVMLPSRLDSLTLGGKGWDGGWNRICIHLTIFCCAIPVPPSAAETEKFPTRITAPGPSQVF